MEYFVAIMLAVIVFVLFLMLLRIGVECGDLRLKLEEQTKYLQSISHYTYSSNSLLQYHLEDKHD